MSYTQYLRDVLEPLGVYQLNAPFNGGELEAQGQALDSAEQQLDQAWREMDLTTAQSWGLERLCALFARRPVAEQPEQLAQALAALLRISGDSFTLNAINDTISGCGIPAHVEEGEAGSVTVSFPGTAGVPSGFEELKQIVEDILPAHLDIQYWFWYLTWRELEERFSCWQDIEDRGLTWEQLEKCIQ